MARNCRWNSHLSYRLMLWAWMLNETSIVFSTAEMSHQTYYSFNLLLHFLSIIFIGLPLVYSEICLTQFTNRRNSEIWDFFPILRGVAYGSVFLVILKIMYAIILCSWYLKYTYYAAFNPPPWMTCEDCEHCMVKKFNTSIFQRCVQSDIMFDEDCGMRLASNCFYQKEIDNYTLSSGNACLVPWKSLLAGMTTLIIVYMISLRNYKFIQLFNKLQTGNVMLTLIVLFCVIMSSRGTWNTQLASDEFPKDIFNKLTVRARRGLLSVGTGCGIINFLSRDIDFRSPATMTTIMTCLHSTLVTALLSLVVNSGIQAMIYFHGMQEVLEMSNSIYFTPFASTSEVFIYFDSAVTVWGVIWFFTIYSNLFINLCIMFLYIKNMISTQFQFARIYKNSTGLLLVIVIIGIMCPFYNVDLTPVLTDSIELIQITSNLLFSISLYWVYGLKNHSVDIVFMIGIKAGLFFKLTWLLSPLLISILLYQKSFNIILDFYDISPTIESISTSCAKLTLYLFLGIYASIIVTGIIIELVKYYRAGKITGVFLKTEDWGPEDKVLFKSRALFVPELMTREFLYRQVRIHGGGAEKVDLTKQKKTDIKQISSVESFEWSVLTSN